MVVDVLVVVVLVVVAGVVVGGIYQSILPQQASGLHDASHSCETLLKITPGSHSRTVPQRVGEQSKNLLQPALGRGFSDKIPGITDTALELRAINSVKSWEMKKLLQ